MLVLELKETVKKVKAERVAAIEAEKAERAALLSAEIAAEQAAVLERVILECRDAAFQGKSEVLFPSIKILPRMARMIEKHSKYISQETGLMYQIGSQGITFHW